MPHNNENLESSSTASAWYLLQTKRHRERLVQLALQRAGVETYLPLATRWPRPVVGSPIAPLFPSYLFTRVVLDDKFWSISWTPGVSSFVAFGGYPVSVDPSIIDLLRSRQDVHGLIDSSGTLAANDTVRIIRGPFQGLTATVIDRLPARERVRVLMEVLQRATPVELPERWIARM